MNTAQLVLSRAHPRDLLDLTKPRLSALVMMSCGAAMIVAPGGPPSFWTAVWTFVGTSGAVAGANTLNCYIERELDAVMGRTRMRPLPAGKLEPGVALTFGILLSLIGVVVLLAVHPIASLLAAIAVSSYVFLYTPLKRHTWWCTLVGAIPGAIPPMIGWVSTSGSLGPGAWALFAWLFLWQPPHFFALASIYRADYKAAGMPMLPVLEERSNVVVRHMVFYTALLIPASMILVPLSRAGIITLIVAPLLGLIYLGVVLRELFVGTDQITARSSFLASVFYLSLVFLVMVLDAGFTGTRG
jgi:protoheme IX farnesyltransferase